MRSPIEGLAPTYRDTHVLKRLGNGVLIVVAVLLSFYYTASFMLKVDSLWTLAALPVWGLVVKWELGKLLRADDMAEDLAKDSPRLARWIDRWASRLFWLVLTLGSIAFSVGGILADGARDTAAEEAAIIASSAERLNIEADLSLLEAQIAGHAADVEKYRAKGWPGSQRKSQEKLDAARADRAELAQRLDDMRGIERKREAAAAGLSPRWAALGGAVQALSPWPLPETSGPAGKLLEQLCALILAILLELESAAMLLQVHLRRIWAEDERRKQDVPPGDVGNTEADQADEEGRRPGQLISFRGHSIAWSDELARRYAQLVENIRNNQTKPTVRAIKAAMKLNANGAEVVRGMLAKDGICVWDARQRQLSPAPALAS